MHGRVKVWRTEEQEKIRKIKEAKIKRDFGKASEAIFNARENGDISEVQLGYLNSVLEIVPDMGTLWNYRREILRNLLSERAGDFSKLSFMLCNELELTGRCIRSSPKSYAVWHHRMWTMKKHPSPDWNSEIEFCTTILKADERNFHCWDYRRFVVQLGNVSYASELGAMDDMIENNFSNFSAWHYRSELLSLPNPPLCSSQSISPPPFVMNKQIDAEFFEEIPPSELELTYNAIYTDPNDQSPWFYHWWLLGRGIRRSYMRELYISRPLKRVVLVFTSPKPRNTVEQLDASVHLTQLSDQEAERCLHITVEKLGGWTSALDEPVSSVWWFPLDMDVIHGHAEKWDTFYPDQLKFEVKICIHDLQNPTTTVCRVPGCSQKHLFCLKVVLDPTQNESVTRVNLDPSRLLNPAISPTHNPEDLLDGLDKVRELLTLEPENKWALLTLVDLQRFVRPPEFHENVAVALNTLMKIDSSRTLRYQHMKVAHAIQDALASVFDACSREISLSNLGIVSPDYLDWCALMTKIDLSGNRMVKLPHTLAYLVCLTELNLDDNQLAELHGISRLPSLLHLSVRRNSLIDLPSIVEILLCPSLESVALHGNEVTKLSALTELLSEHPSSRCRSHSLNVTYDRPLTD